MHSAVKHIQDYTGVNVLFHTHSRERKLVEHRSLFVYMVMKHSRVTYQEVGRFLNKNHATIIHGRKLYEIIRTPEFDSIVDTYVPEEDLNINLYRLITSIDNTELKKAICKIVSTEVSRYSETMEENFGGQD